MRAKKEITKHILFLILLCGVLFISNDSFSQQINLLGQAPINGGALDIAGYVDSTGNEYALVGSGQGLTIYDVSNPSTPTQISNINVPGFDVKAYGHYVYCVTGGGGTNAGKIVDIRDPSNPQIAGSFNSSHNIFIDENGYMYQESPGLIIRDISANPTNPPSVFTGGVEGHDASKIGDRLFDFHGSAGTNIYNITNPASPQLLGSITAPSIEYHHSGWTTEDGNYLLICDELSNHPSPDITVWDISDYGNMIQIDQFADPDATVHNLYIKGSYAFVSYYDAGFRVFDVSTPADIQLVDEFDPVPGSNPGFAGAFGLYIFTPSGNIYMSDDAGLYVFSFDSTVTGINPVSTAQPDGFALKQNFPNPFNPSTRISFDIPSVSEVKLTVYNSLGKEVTELINENLSAGTYERTFDGSNLSSGIYYYTLRTGEFSETKKMLLIK